MKTTPSGIITGELPEFRLVLQPYKGNNAYTHYNIICKTGAATAMFHLDESSIVMNKISVMEGASEHVRLMVIAFKDVADKINRRFEIQKVVGEGLKTILGDEKLIEIDSRTYSYGATREDFIPKWVEAPKILEFANRLCSGDYKSAIYSSGRNDLCPCQSGKKFKQCCQKWVA